MQNKFFGSKLKAILWLVIGILVLWAISKLLKNNGYLSILVMMGKDMVQAQV